MREFNVRQPLMLGVALYALVSSPSFAQTTPMEDTDIVVTARRVEERLQDVPISITVFNQDQLSKRNVSTGQDLVTYTPSLTASGQYGSQNTVFALRGFTQENGTAPTTGVYMADVVAPRGGLSTLVAGDSIPPGSFFDLQNVQVLKGPQGTLFGRNTTGGAVLVVPQKPKAEFGGYLEGSIGNYDMKRLQGALNVPLGDQARARIAFDRHKRDGYVENTGRDPSGNRIGPKALGDIDYLAVRASLVVDLTPNLENYTIVTYNRSNTVGEAQSLYECDPAHRLGNLSCAQLERQRAQGTDGFYTAQTSVDMFNNLEVWQIINTTTWAATDAISVKNIASYGQLKQDLSTGLFGTLFDAHDLNLAAPVGTPAHNVNPAVPAGTYVDFVGNVSVPGGHYAHQETFTNEFRVAGRSLDSRLNWQTGVYYETSAPLSSAGTVGTTYSKCSSVDPLLCINPLGAGTVSVNRTQNTFRNVGVYAQGDFAVTDQLKFTAGIRYTWDRVTNTYSSMQYRFASGSITPVPPVAGTIASPNPTCTPFSGALPDCVLTKSANSKAPTWLLGLDYKPVDDILLYAKYSRGYRSGGVNVSLPEVLTYTQPEKVDTYEAGIKTSFRGAVRGSFNISGFYNDFSNQILRINYNRTATNQTLAAAVNAGRSRIYGVEVEASLTPFEGLTLDGNYAYLNGKITDVTVPELPANSGLAPLGGYLSDDPLPFTPKHKFTLTGTYTLPLDESIGRISFGATLVHVGRQVANSTYRVNDAGVLCPLPTEGCRITGPSILPAYELLNLNASWNDIGGSPFDLSLFATNVTKKKYLTYTQVFIVAGGFNSRQLGQPRTFGLRLRYRFGD